MQDAAKLVLSNADGPLDERIVRAPKTATPERVAAITAAVAADFLLQIAEFHAGDTLRVEAANLTNNRNE